MALNYIPAPIQQPTNPLLGRVGASIGNFASGLYNGVKNIASNPATFGTQNQVQYDNNGFTSFTPKSTTQNYIPVPTPANPAATGTVNTTTSSPAAQKYIQSQIQPPATGLYNSSTGLTANGLNPSQVAQGYSTIQGNFNPLTGQPNTPGGGSNTSTTQGTQPYTPQPTQPTNSNTSNTQQIDPNTGQQASPTSNPQLDQAYQTYLQSIQLQQPVINLQNQLSQLNSQILPQQTAIGRQPILQGFATGQQQQAFANDQAQIQSVTGQLTQAQDLQANQQNAAQAGLSYQQFLQSQEQAKQIAELPTPTGYGQTSFNPATNSFGAQGGANLNPQTQATTLAQQVASGKMSYADAVAGLAYAGSAGTAFLQQALQQIPGLNLNQLEGQAAGAQQGAATIAGNQGNITAQQQTQIAGYQSALQQGQNLQSQLGDLITTFGLNSNDINAVNSGIQKIAANTSSTQYQILKNYVNDIANTYAQILTPSGGSQTDTTRNIAANMLDATAKGTSIKATMAALDQAAQAKITGVSTTGNSSGGSASPSSFAETWFNK